MALTAAAEAPVEVMSATVVMPEATASKPPSSAESSQSCRERSMAFSSTAFLYGAYGTSGEAPRRAVYSRWVCRSTKPGMMAASPKSRVFSSG